MVRFIQAVLDAYRQSAPAQLMGIFSAELVEGRVLDTGRRCIHMMRILRSARYRRSEEESKKIQAEALGVISKGN